MATSPSAALQKKKIGRPNSANFKTQASLTLLTDNIGSIDNPEHYIASKAVMFVLAHLNSFPGKRLPRTSSQVVLTYVMNGLARTMSFSMPGDLDA